jgi:GH24 family phage-related lysozyme (muramidase)
MGRFSHLPGGFDRQMEWLDLCMPLVFQDLHTDRAGNELMRTQWLPYLEHIVDGIYPGVPPHEKAALISLYSQMGYCAIARSSIRLLIDLGRKHDACTQWLEWCLIDGVPIIERRARRQKEVDLYLHGVISPQQEKA